MSSLQHKKLEKSRKSRMVAKKRAQQGRKGNDGRHPGPSREAVAHKPTNHQVIVLATYILGGERRPIDTEDLAVKANELAPGRFSWRKFRDQINLELVRVYASDSKKPAHGALLRGSGNEGWMLTQAGLTWAEENLDCLKGLRQSRERNRKADRVLKAERARLRASEAFRKLHAEPGEAVTPREAETFFRLDPYITGSKREERILRILNAFGDDPELGAVVNRLANQVRKPSGATQHE
jgi:hypothetical protein